MRIATYIRVSTDDQETENQVPEVEELASRRGEVVQRYAEKASAVKYRPEFERMLKDAKQRKFDVLVIWAIDRFGRSMAANVHDISELDRIGVQVVSVKESWLDTGGPTRLLLVSIFSWMAEQERNRIIERTKAGMATARRAGKRIGRPRRRFDVDEARQLLATGASQVDVARRLGVGRATLQRHLAHGEARS